MITICWWDTSGNEQRIPVAQLGYVPAVGSFVDLEGVRDELLEEHISEDERCDLSRMQVVDVLHGLTGIDVTVERDPETVHQRELEAKDASLVHVQCTTSHLLDLLQIVVADCVFFALEGGGDKRDLVAVHIAEGTTLDPALVAAVDAVFVYPTREAARRRDTPRRCIKHHHAELVSNPK